MNSHKLFNGLVILTLLLSFVPTRHPDPLSAAADLAATQPVQLQAPGNPLLEPARNVHTVPLTTSVSITYDEAIDPTTVSTRTFAVHAMQTGLLTQTYGVNGGAIMLTPTQSFKPGELVQVSATTGTLNLSGQGPVSPTVWQFRAAVLGGSGVFADSGLRLGGADSRSIALGDIDNDGDNDAIVGNDGGNKVWLNVDTGIFTDTGQSLGNSDSNAVALGDLDNDGDLDLFIGNYWDGANKVWLNDGTGVFTDSGQTLGSARSQRVVLGDLDGDADLDAFVANDASQANRVWLNDGSGGFSLGQSLGSASSFGVALGDLDADGDLDAFIANYWDAAPDEVWLNDGSGQFTDSTQRLGNVYSYAVDLGDIDADGDLDVVVGNSGPNKVWLNDGTGVFTDSGQGLGNAYSEAIALADLNGDGTLDILTGSQLNQPIEVWLNDGTGSFYASGQQLTSMAAQDLALGDIDGDGDIDAFFANDNVDDRVWLNQARLTLNKSISPTGYVHFPNSTVTYTLDYHNITSNTLVNVTISDALAPQLHWLHGGVYSDTTRTVHFDLGNLAPHATGNVSYATRLKLQQPSSGLTETVTNTATIAVDGQVDARSNPVSVAIYGPALEISKVVTSTDNARPGDVITYTLHVTNSGNVTATHITVSDNIPAYSSAAGSTLLPAAAGLFNNTVSEGTSVALQLQGDDIYTWNVSRTLPVSLTWPGAAQFERYAYILGGRDTASTYLDEVYVSTLDTDGRPSDWVATTPLPFATKSVASVAYNGYLYAIGGYTGTAVNTVYYAPIYANGTIGVWNATTPLSETRYGLSTVIAKGYLYIIGQGFSGTPNDNVYYAAIEPDGSLGNWRTTTSLPNRAEPGIAVSGNRIYVVRNDCSNVVYSALVQDDGTLSAWRTENSLPRSAIQISRLIATRGQLFVIGGGGCNGGWLNTVYRAQINSDGTLNWSLLNRRLPAQTWWHNAAGYRGYLYVLGGTPNHSTPNGRNTVYWASVTPTNTYAYRGAYLSPIVDLGVTQTVHSLSWQATSNAQVVELQYRTTVTQTWGAWSVLTSDRFITVDQPARFLQYRAALSGDSSATPIFRGVTVHHSPITSTQTYTWSIEMLAPGESVTITWLAQVQDYFASPLDTYAITNTATVSSAEVGLVSSNVVTTLLAPPTCHVRLNDNPNAYPTVQAAIDAAQDGDTVKVAGTCVGVQSHAGLLQTAYISKSITLRGGYTTTNWTTSNPVSYPTTLDAQTQGRVVYIVGNISPTVEGLRITSGDAAGLGGHIGGEDAGGGICIQQATATISNNQVISNVANHGGGLYINGSAAKIINNTVITNATTLVGGGFYLYNTTARLESNTIAWNYAPQGGGLRLHSNAAMLEGNVIIRNTSTSGGGAAIGYDNSTLINNVIADNQASTGSGLSIAGSFSHLSHNTIDRNSKGGSGVYITNFFSTFSNVTLTNTLITSHTVGIIVTTGSTATLESTLWYSNSVNWDNTGTLYHTHDYTGTPAFVNPDAGDYHIGPTSAAIDRGINAGITTDFEGDPRPTGTGYDIGADEFTGTHIVPPTTLTLTGPLTGTPHIPATFTTTVNPTATLPLTFTWHNAATTLTRPVSRITDTAVFSWTMAGTQVITATATNAAGTISATHTITISAPPPTCPHPLNKVTLAGPTSGYTATTYTVTGTLAPANPTAPVTLTWTPTPLNGQGTLTATYQWITPAVYTLTLRAANCGGAVTATHTITISNPCAVVATFPAPNALAVAARSVISVTFNRAVLSSTLTARTFTVRGAQTGVYTGVSRIGNPLYFTPTHPFKPGEEVEVALSTGIQALDGAPLRPYSWRFRVAAGAGSGHFGAGVTLTLALSDTFAVAVGDVDGDGTVDAVLANYGQGLGEANTVWLNQAGLQDSGQRLGNAPSLALALGDVDGDGDLDAVVGNEGPNRVWLNAGGIFTATAQTLGTLPTWRVALGDVDGDGDLDAVFAQHQKPSELWLNAGTGHFSLADTFSGGDTFAIALADLNGDGRLDMFLAQRNNQANRVYFNDGGGHFQDSGQRLGAASSLAVTLADMDGDGDLDAVVGNEGQTNLVWFNDGQGNFATSRFLSDQGLSFAVPLADVDGDGDLDAVVVNYAAPNTVWLNAGAGDLTLAQTLPFSDTSRSGALADFDGDGDSDWLVANRSGANMVWYNLDRPVASFTAAPLTGTAPLTVVFTNTSRGAYAHLLWDFGDGITRTAVLTQPSLHHQYAAGTYTVTLQVDGPAGAAAVTQPAYIKVVPPTPPVTADFTAQPLQGHAPLTVTFTNHSQGHTSSQWDFGDGTTSVQEQPTHTYTLTGTHSVTLQVTGPGGQDMLSQVITVTAPLTYIPPYVTHVTLSPVPTAAITNDLTLAYVYHGSLAEQHSRTFWALDGIVQPRFNDQQKTVSNFYTLAGDTWCVRVQPYDGVTYGPITPAVCTVVEYARNQRPQALAVLLAPRNPKLNQTLNVTYTYFDFDNDPENFGPAYPRFRWSRNGTLQPKFNDQATIAARDTYVGEQWCVTVEVHDGVHYSVPVAANCVIINPLDNNLPWALTPTISPTQPISGSALTLTYTYSDVETLVEGATQIRWYYGETLQPAYNDQRQVPAGVILAGSVWHATVRPHDGQDYGLLVHTPPVSVTWDTNTLPEALHVQITPALPREADPLQVEYEFQDLDGDTEGATNIYWYKDLVHQPDYDGFTRIPPSATLASEVWHAVVVPHDGHAAGADAPAHSVQIKGPNHRPRVVTMTLIPATPQTDDNIQVRYVYADDNKDPQAQTRIIWTADAVTQTLYNDHSLVPSAATLVGQIWCATVIPHDGWDEGAAATACVTITAPVPERAPEVYQPHILPEQPPMSNTIELQYTFIEHYGATEKDTHIEWYLQRWGALTYTLQARYTGQTVVPGGATRAGDRWYATLQPCDDHEPTPRCGRLYTSPVITVNTPPTVSNIHILPEPPPPLLPGGALEVMYKFHDRDHDLEQRSQYRWWFNNTRTTYYNKILPAGATITAARHLQNQEWSAQVIPCDHYNCGALSAHSPVRSIPPAPNVQHLYLPLIMRDPYVTPDWCTEVTGYEDNDTFYRVCRLTPNTIYTAYPDDEHDWYFFTITQTTSIRVRLTNYQANGQLLIYDSTMQFPFAFSSIPYNLLGRDRFRSPIMQVANARDPASLNDLRPGIYYVYIHTDAATFNVDQPYRLTLTELP